MSDKERMQIKNKVAWNWNMHANKLYKTGFTNLVYINTGKQNNNGNQECLLWVVSDFNLQTQHQHLWSTSRYKRYKILSNKSSFVYYILAKVVISLTGEQALF